MSTRTLENCSLIKKYGLPEQFDEKCAGLAIDYDDDEPCNVCKNCKLNYYYEEGQNGR